MSGGVLNINGTQTPDIKNYFSPPPLSRSGADDQALRSRLEEMGIHSDSYTASASRFKKMTKICRLGFVLLFWVELIMLGQRQLCSTALPESTLSAVYSQVS